MSSANTPCVPKPSSGTPSALRRTIHEVGVDTTVTHFATANDDAVVCVDAQTPRAVGGERGAVEDAGAEVELDDAVGAERRVLRAVRIDADDRNVAISRASAAPACSMVPAVTSLPVLCTTMLRKSSPFVPFATLRT